MILADYCPLDALFHRNHGKLFRLITSLIFNGFSIRKKFWKAETQGFPTIAFTVCHVKSMGAFTAGNSLVLPVVIVLSIGTDSVYVYSSKLNQSIYGCPVPCIFQVFVPTRVSTDPGHGTRIGWTLLLPKCPGTRSLLIVLFLL